MTIIQILKVPVRFLPSVSLGWNVFRKSLWRLHKLYWWSEDSLNLMVWSATRMWWTIYFPTMMRPASTTAGCQRGNYVTANFLAGESVSTSFTWEKVAILISVWSEHAGNRLNAVRLYQHEHKECWHWYAASKVKKFSFPEFTADMRTCWELYELRDHR